MLLGNRPLYLWCGLLAVILSLAILPDSSFLQSAVADGESGRWVHFVAYALATALPVAIWRGWSRILYSLLGVIAVVAIESLRPHFVPTPVSIDQIPADMFGFAAGVLLGLNLRLMRTSQRNGQRGSALDSPQTAENSASESSQSILH